MVRLFCDLKLHMSTQVGGVIRIIIHTTASLSMKADPSKIADKEQIIFQFYTEAAKADERHDQTDPYCDNLHLLF